MTNDPIVHALLDLTQAVGNHPDAMADGTWLNAAFIKACDVLRSHVDPCGSAFSPEARESVPGEEVAEEIRWLKWQADMMMAGDDKFANRCLYIAEMLQRLSRAASYLPQSQRGKE